VVGGSEAVSAEAAAGFASRGWEVEVLTTCAVDHFTWENALPEGTGEEEGILVRRFATVREPSRVALRAQEHIAGGVHPSLDEQITWLSLQFRVPGLFHHLLAHGDEFDAVVFSPYLFWTTVVGLRTVAERAVVMPCLHDEVYAHLEVFRHVLADPAAVWFLSEPEHALGHRLGPVASHHTVTGAGVHVPDGYHPEEFKRRHGLGRPFVLYAGRRETGKGWDWLVDVFASAVRAGVELDLVTIGVGEVEVPVELEGRLVDLGLVSASERDDALAAAVAYIQPSRMESFSRSVMESWLARTPVLATADGEVVAWHCERSGGGLLFSDGDELVALLQKLSEDRSEARALAERGRRYVVEQYSWEAVLDRMEQSVWELG
jgi:glycosyltransferase involved in cell wall biosynthesis